MNSDSLDQMEPTGSGFNPVVRLQRYKTLLAQKWWVLLTCALVGLAGFAVYAWRAPTSYVSAGRMFVGSKLNLPEARTYDSYSENL